MGFSVDPRKIGAVIAWIAEVRIAINHQNNMIYASPARGYNRRRVLIVTMKKTPTDIRLHSKSNLLEITFIDEVFKLPCEYLRVYSPSAEVQGHGPGQEVLQVAKEDVGIVAIEPVGHYAVRLIFSDSHNSGLYSWDYLYELGSQRQQRWQDYLARLADAGEQRTAQDNDQYLT